MTPAKRSPRRLKRKQAVRRDNSARRGSTYVLVLGVAMVVTVLGFSALLLARINTVATLSANDWAEAGTLAFSATEHALADLNDSSGGVAWRSSFQSGVLAAEHALGRGTLSWMLVDEEDGDLADELTDPVRLYGIGRVGQAVRVYSVVLFPSGEALDVLRTAVQPVDPVIR